MYVKINYRKSDVQKLCTYSGNGPVVQLLFVEGMPTQESKFIFVKFATCSFSIAIL